MDTSSRRNDPLTEQIIGAAIAVQEYYGTGFLEAVYQDSLEIEFQRRGIPFVREAHLPIYYGTHKIRSHYQADFICFNSIIVELKALTQLSGNEESQVLNYLKVTRLHKALLLNFGEAPLGIYRYVM